MYYIICLQKLAASKDGSVVIPENIHPYVFTTLAYDNTDLMELPSLARVRRRVDGRATTHTVWTTFRQTKVPFHREDEAKKYCIILG